MRNALLFPVILLCIPLVVGCTMIKKQSIETGLFQNNVLAMIAAYEKVEKGHTFEEIEALGFHLGFTHQKPENVLDMEGVGAIKNVLGEESFQASMGSIMHDQEKLAKMMSGMDSYRVFVIPYLKVVTTKDQFYISKQETLREGQDLKIKLLFKDGKLLYRSKSDKTIKEKESDRAFLKGLIDLLNNITGVSSDIEKYKGDNED